MKSWPMAPRNGAPGFTTDELGQALFDLDGLGAGRNYF